MLVLCRNGRKQKFTDQNTELGTLCSGFAEPIKLCIISFKIYAAIMVKITFEIKTNI